MIDSSIEVSKDSNKIICELVGIENDELNSTIVEDKKFDKIKMTLNKDDQGRKLIKGILSSETFSLYLTHFLLFQNVWETYYKTKGFGCVFTGG